MRVGYIQFDVKRDLNENLHTIEKHLRKMNVDLVVLPELCTCGYLFENKEQLKKSAEVVPGGAAVTQMQKLSEKYHCAIIFGLAELEEDQIYNTAVVVNKGSYVGKYRKIHLTDLEKTLFDRGTSNKIFEIDGHKIGVEICFDIWFPEVFREQVRMGAELFCALGNFGGETTFELCPFRALENITPTVLCNRVGKETVGEMEADYLGKSSIISSTGERLSIGEPKQEVAAVCEVTLSTVHANIMCQDFDKEMALHYQ